MSIKYFVAADYCVLVIVLLISSLIGVFFAWKDRKSVNNKDFLVGNRQLQVFPVTMSMMASFLSAISMLGLPAESFVHGSQYYMTVIGCAIAIVLAAEVFLPVFYDMEMISVNQYLEKRYGSPFLRKTASVIVVIQMCFYLGVVLYGPSLALGSVTGLPVWLSIVVNGVVCTFYTSIGGIKAVVWTDVVQMVLMIIGFLVVSIKGSQTAGGIGEVYRIAQEQGILEFFDFRFDFQKTFTFWSVVVGSTVIWTMAFCANQTMIQRYCSIGSMRSARRALYINLVGISGSLVAACFCGLVLFAVYHKCDPVKASFIVKYDQLMPYFVTDALHHVPGISGLFVAAVYSGSLSTMSSGYNALAAVTWEDFFKDRMNISPIAVMWVTKGIAAFFGLLTIGLAFLAGSLSSIMSAAFVTTGSFGGALGALFFLGLLFPWCGSKTALLSMLTGIGVAAWIAAGSLLYPATPVQPRTTLDGCTSNITVRTLPPRVFYTGGIMELYHISYLWVPVLSFAIPVLLAVSTTLLIGIKNAAPVDPSLIARPLRRIYKKFSGGVLPSSSAGECKKGDHSNLHDTGHVNLAIVRDDGKETLAAQSTTM
ncbi:sodium-coupled monocarboxylate transporter 2-like [Ornithodoros turicata]|uniref:sodium-coupled monocarboxylate transporter 2-like n=1 Tax=Ornithodoros turicata TaxID=34597 RepID=UPI0031395A7E